MRTQCAGRREDRAEERLEAVAMGQRPQVPALVDDRLRQRRVRRVRASTARSRECVARGTRPRRLRSPRARSSRWRRPVVRPAPRRRPRAAASAARRRRAPAGRPRAGASGCRDRGAACRGPSTARRRARRSNDAREGQRPRADRPGPAGRWSRRWRATVRRSKLHPALAHVARDDAARRRRIAAAIAVVLPPGDAQVSSTRAPGLGPASSATSCDASSCTTNQPSLAARRRAADGPPRR